MTETVEATPRNLRSFGLVLGGILGLFAFLSFRKGGGAFPYFVGSGFFFSCAALWVPMTLRPVFLGWMRLAGLLAAVNTYIVTGAVFYILMAPYGLWARWRGWDLLDERLGTGDSYWIPREPARDLESYERQF